MTNELSELMAQATLDLKNPDRPEEIVARYHHKTRRRRVALAGAALVIAGTAIAVPVATNPESSGVDRLFPAAIPTSPEPTQQRTGNPNCKVLKPISVTGGGSGPTTYTYRYGSTTVTRVIPAPDFDPTSASDTELIKNGYPPRPTDARQLALWRQLVKSKIVGPGLCVDNTEREGPAAAPSKTASGLPR